MTTKPASWTEPTLFEGGYELVTLTLTLHANGPLGEIVGGWLLQDTATDEWIAAKVYTAPQGLAEHAYPIGLLVEALKRADGLLKPF